MKIELAGQAPERVATLGHVLPAVFAFTQESTPLKVRSQETWHITQYAIECMWTQTCSEFIHRHTDRHRIHMCPLERNINK